MSAESPKAYIQTNEAGQLESTDRAVDIAEKAKRELDNLLEEVQSTFPSRESMTTETIRITEQTDITEKGLLAILAEACPALKDAFAKNPRLTKYTYGQMFSEMAAAGLDANAVPVIPEKPVALVMQNGRITISVPFKGDGGALEYKSANFDLLPWPEETDAPDVIERGGLELDDDKPDEVPAEEAPYTPDENAEKVPAFMDALDTMDGYMKDYERSTAQTRRRLDNGKITKEEAESYLGESDNILENISALHAERNRLAASRGLENASLKQVDERIQAYKDQYGMLEEYDPDADKKPHLARDTRLDAKTFIELGILPNSPTDTEPVPEPAPTAPEPAPAPAGTETIDPAENPAKIKELTGYIEAREKAFKQYEREARKVQRHLDDGTLTEEMGESFIAEHQMLEVSLELIEEKRDALVESGAIQGATVTRIDGDINALKQIFDDQNDTYVAVSRHLIQPEGAPPVEEAPETEEDPKFREYIGGIRDQYFDLYGSILEQISKETGLDTNAQANLPEMVNRKGKVSLIVESRVRKDTVDISSRAELTMPGMGRLDQVKLPLNQSSTEIQKSSLDLKYGENPIQGAREAALLAKIQYLENFDPSKLIESVQNLLPTEDVVPEATPTEATPAPEPEPAPPIQPITEIPPPEADSLDADPAGDKVNAPTGYEGETHDDLDEPEEVEAPKQRLFKFGNREEKEKVEDDDRSTDLPTGSLD